MPPRPFGTNLIMVQEPPFVTVINSQFGNPPPQSPPPLRNYFRPRPSLRLGARENSCGCTRRSRAPAGVTNQPTRGCMAQSPPRLAGSGFPLHSPHPFTDPLTFPPVRAAGSLACYSPVSHCYSDGTNPPHPACFQLLDPKVGEGVGVILLQTLQHRKTPPRRG